ncbi:MAG: hypothetical protein ACRYFE_08885 [Janthinobacterium lividum]
MADDTSIKDKLRSAFRDFRVDGVPASGPQEPVKAEVREALGRLADRMEAVATGVVNGVRGYAILADLPELGPVDGGVLAKVEETGLVYRWNGAAWEEFADPTIVAADRAELAAGAAEEAAEQNAAKKAPDIPPAMVVLDALRRIAVQLSSDGRTFDVAGLRLSIDDAGTGLVPFDDSRPLRLGSLQTAPAPDGYIRVTADPTTGRIGEVLYEDGRYGVGGFFFVPTEDGAELRGPDARLVLRAYNDGRPPYFAGHGAGQAGVDYVLVDGDLRPLVTDMSVGSGWGSSSMERTGPALQSIMAARGVDFFNGGKGGERIQHSAARQGAMPALLTFPANEIPASGSVEVTANNVSPSSSMLSFTGEVAGVAGTLSSTASALSFTRASAGAAVSVTPGSALIPHEGVARRGGFQVLWLGKNNLGVAGADALVIEGTDACFEYHSAMARRVLVVGQFVDTDTAIPSLESDQIQLINDYQRARYQRLFIDIEAWMCSEQAWIDTGIVPTSSDLLQQAEGRKPSSLSVDSGHFTTHVYGVIAEKLILARMLELGWLN